MTEIEPFTVDVPAEVLDDLRDRLRRTRWPEPEPVDDWSQGTPLAYLQDLCAYWADEYDWPARQRLLNRFPQYRTTIDGLGVHFLHVPSPHPDAMPLVLTHGWPGSVVEFLDVVGPLTDPVADGGEARDAFSVVVPSLPGYGWSDRPDRTGWGVEAIAAAWAELMTRLGYERFGAQGGDWGSTVTRALADAVPDRLTGIHLNMVSVRPDRDGDLTDAERRALDRFAEHRDQGTGYSTQQATRPQTLGYGLTDSPAGQLGWILEKFAAWADVDGDPVGVLGADRLLDNAMLYWVPGTAASSARLYRESFRREAWPPTAVPMGAAIFPHEIFTPSRRWAERAFTDIRRWSELPAGGHFAALEQPEVFVQEVRAFFRTVR
ncbi:epoxide hydrolase family protein [Blastococcus sp. TF02A-26]|uniref:epoxide hydrolase family protein n=1 Tax=Blastococcus sp. TF02A-26 TaxID=2250577 RepID=UPI0018F40521|nr:epoxide hydrolase family protein [Blastococcus sp. TF02A-26]